MWNQLTDPENQTREYLAAKAREMAEMEAFMKGLNENPDPCVLYRWRDAVTDIKQMLQKRAAEDGDRTLFMQKFHHNQPYTHITYRQVLEDVNALGTALLKLGLESQNIGVVGRNCYQWAETYLAVVGGVGVIVPLDKELHQGELKQLTAKGDLTAVVTDSKHFEDFCQIRDSGETKLRYIIGIDVAPEDQVPEEGIISWEKLREAGRQLVAEGDRAYIDAEVYNDRLAIILFTSGTTGVSKGVMLCHKNIITDVMMAQTFIQVEKGDVFFSLLPIHHTYECTCSFIESIYCTGSLAFCQGLKYIVSDLQEAEPTLLLAVPLIYEKLYSKIIREIRKQGKEKQLNALFEINKVTKKIGLDISKPATKQIRSIFGPKLRTPIVGGAAADVKVLDFLTNLGYRAVQGYGLTETSPMVTLNPDRGGHTRNESIGHVFPMVECMIYEPDKTGVGEICFKGPNIMLGYYKDEEATKAAMFDGWFHTGDLGYMSKDKYVYITGRKKNMILTANGENVYPEELESYLLKSDYVEECMVWGDDQAGTVNNNRICATIRVSEETVQEKLGENYSDQAVEKLIQDLVDDINKEMPAFKKINRVIIRKRPFNVTTAMKIRRFVKDNREA